MAKMTNEQRREYHLSRFQDHRQLLQSAVQGMRGGDLTQALVAATSIRVLLHETGTSKPLLKQLKPNYLDLDIYDSQPTQDWTDKHAKIYLPIGLSFENGEVRLETKFEPTMFKLVRLGHWWTRNSLVVPDIGPMSRREIILGLANTEAAHVDSDLSPKYRRLLQSKGVMVHGPEGELSPLNLSRMMAGKAAIHLLDCFDRNFGPL